MHAWFELDQGNTGLSNAWTSLLLKNIPWNNGQTPNAGQYDTSYSSFPGGFWDSSEGYVYNVPGTTSGTDYFILRAWTGNFTNFNAALEGGALVGTTPVFINPVEYGINPIPDLTNMPALIVKPALPGDANLDGKVDINDLTIVLANYGQSGTVWSTGDFNADGKVDINDLTIVLANYGQSDGESAAGIKAVPEPSCVVLLGVGGVSLLAFAWRKWRAS